MQKTTTYNLFAAGLLMSAGLSAHLSAQCPVMHAGDSTGTQVTYLVPDTLVGYLYPNVSSGYWKLEPAGPGGPALVLSAGLALEDHGVATHNISASGAQGLELAYRDGMYIRHHVAGDSIRPQDAYESSAQYLYYSAGEPIPPPGSGTYTGSGPLDWMPHTWLGFRFPAGQGWKYGWVEIDMISVEPGLQVHVRRCAWTDCIAIAREEQSQAAFSVWPNPALDAFTIRWETAVSQTRSWELCDAAGRVSLRGSVAAGVAEVSVSTDEAPAGLYLLRVITGDRVHTQRLVVGH